MVDGDDRGIAPPCHQADSRRALRGKLIVKEGTVESQWTASEAMAPVNTASGLESPVSGRSEHQPASYEKEFPTGLHRHRFRPLHFVQIQRPAPVGFGNMNFEKLLPVG